MYIQLEYSGEWLELKNTDEKKWRGNISLPLPLLSLPQIPSQLTLRAEALRSRPHNRHSAFVLRVRESWDYSRKTTGGKNNLHGVEPPYLLPLLPLSLNISRVTVRESMGKLYHTSITCQITCSIVLPS